MDENKKSELISLKAEILNDILPLVETSGFDPVQKFELLLSSARISDEPSRYRAAYEAIKQIEDTDIKANALLDLLDSIEEVTNSITQTSESEVQNESEPEELQAVA